MVVYVCARLVNVATVCLICVWIIENVQGEPLYDVVCDILIHNDTINQFVPNPQPLVCAHNEYCCRDGDQKKCCTKMQEIIHETCDKFITNTTSGAIVINPHRLACPADEYCCGERSEPRCCSKFSSGAIVGVCLSLVVICGIIVCCTVACCIWCTCCPYRKSRKNHSNQRSKQSNIVKNINHVSPVQVATTEFTRPVDTRQNNEYQDDTLGSEYQPDFRFEPTSPTLQTETAFLMVNESFKVSDNENSSVSKANSLENSL